MKVIFNVFGFNDTLYFTNNALYLAYKKSFDKYGFFLDKSIWEKFRGRELFEITKHLNINIETAKLIEEYKNKIYPYNYYNKIIYNKKLDEYIKFIYPTNNNITFSLNNICDYLDIKTISNVIYNVKFKTGFLGFKLKEKILIDSIYAKDNINIINIGSKFSIYSVLADKIKECSSAIINIFENSIDDLQMISKINFGENKKINFYKVTEKTLSKINFEINNNIKNN